MLSTGTIPILKIGRADTNFNCYQISYTHAGDGNVLNRLTISHKGATFAETLTFTANGRLGLGSVTPTERLEIGGNINISAGNYYRCGGINLISGVPSNSGCRIGDNAGIGLECYVSNLLRYGGAANFNLGINNVVLSTFGVGETCGIGLSDDVINMFSAGDAGAIIYRDEDNMNTGFSISMTGAISTFSDRRLKKRIEPLIFENVLDEISAVEVVKYKRKRPPHVKRQTNKYSRWEYGIIAQDFRKQFNIFVKKSILGEDIGETDIDENGDLKDDNYFFVDKTNMYLPLFQAVKELYERVKNIEANIQKRS